MTKRDIVMRLCGPINILSADDLAYEAADAITRLREELAEAKAESLHAKSSLSEQVATLIHERDEARKLWCHAMWLIGGKRPNEQAKAKGWDCFGDKTP